MCDGIVIDAHVIRAIRDDLVRGEGTLYELIEWIIGNCGIAITRKIEAHWKSKCPDRDSFFWAWYAEQVLNKSVHAIPPKKLGAGVTRKIHNDYGLPLEAPFVVGYIECAAGTTEPRYILAEDMDLHDPYARRQTTSAQINIKEQRIGALCRYLEKRLRIRVGAVSDATSYFRIGVGPCPSRVTINQNKCPKLPSR